MTPRITNRAVVLGALVVALASVSTVAVAAVSGGMQDHGVTGHTVVGGNNAGHGMMNTPPVGSTAACSAPALSGTVVDVALTDVAGMMAGAQMQWRTFHPGMMRLVAPRSVAAHGVVSFRVRNTGAIKHELVILPLSAGQVEGARTVGPDGKIDESGALGEVSLNCGADKGEGIKPAGAGWSTLKLPAGRYELVCNLQGHYRAGMHSELDIS